MRRTRKRKRKRKRIKIGIEEGKKIKKAKKMEEANREMEEGRRMEECQWSRGGGPGVPRERKEEAAGRGCPGRATPAADAQRPRGLAPEGVGRLQAAEQDHREARPR